MKKKKGKIELSQQEINSIFKRMDILEENKRKKYLEWASIETDALQKKSLDEMKTKLIKEINNA